MPQIRVKGKASGKEFGPFSFTPSEMTLLEFLINLNIPLAYSCYGEGVCKKCRLIIEKKERLSCQVLMKDLGENDILISVDYL